MKTQVKRWGNSWAVRIPKAFAAEIGLDQDTNVEMTIVDGDLVIKRVRKPKFTVEELLANFDETKRHEETDTGPAVGKEEW
jgi:antitoxin MazE